MKYVNGEYIELTKAEKEENQKKRQQFLEEKKLESLKPNKKETEKAERQINLINDLKEFGVI